MSAAIILIIACCIRFVNSFNSSLLNIAVMQVLYLSLVLVVFEGSYIKRISYDILGNAIMAGSEFLLIIFLSHPSNFSLHQVKDNQFSMMIHLIGIKTIAFIMFNIVKRIPRNSNSRMDLKRLL